MTLFMRKLTLCFLAVFAVCSNAELPRYDDGARWAFISEADSKHIAVVDTFKYQLADRLELKAVPTELVVSDVQDVLVYIDGVSNKVFSYDLITHTHSEMALERVPHSIVFHSDGAQLAVASQDRIDIIKPLKQEYVASIEGIKSPFSMNFDNGGYNLYITEAKTGNTLIYRNHDGQQTHIQLGEGNVSALTLSPDARLALVSDHSTNSVFVWDLFNEAPYKSYPMTAKPWRPYVSSDSEHMIFVDDNGLAQIVNTWSGETVNNFQFKQAPKSIRTGWLETIGIVESEKSLNIFELTKANKATSLALKHPLNEVVVVSDSKTLFATQQNSSDLFIYDIRQNKLLPAINTGLKQPQHIVMGITNTICH